MSESVSSRARARLRAEMEKRRLSQTDVADLLEWKQSRLSKVLNGRTELDVDDLAALCFAVGISVTEAVRDHGLEFCAEMTPTELRILERIRHLPAPVLDSILILLDVKTKTGKPERFAAQPVKKKPYFRGGGSVG